MFPKNRADFSAFFFRGKYSFTLAPVKLAQLLDISAQIASEHLQKHPTLTMFPQKDFIPRR